MDANGGNERCPGGVCSPPSRGAAPRHRRSLSIVLALTAAYLTVEIIGGLATGSLALIADAGHMLTDVGALVLALFALWLAGRPAGPQKTYGYYRAEILAALVNATLLFLVAGYVFYEAYQRFQAPPAVDTLPMLLVAGTGLIVNIGGAWLLRRGAEESLNVHAAFLEVVADALASLGVLVGGIIMHFTGFYLIDPLMSGLIGLLILPRTWKLLNRALNILLEGTPAHINVAEVKKAMLSVGGVSDVHDLHIWTITAGFEAMSGHAVVRGAVDQGKLLDELHAILRERFGVDHLTIQIEEEGGALIEDIRQRHIGE